MSGHDLLPFRREFALDHVQIGAANPADLHANEISPAPGAGTASSRSRSGDVSTAAGRSNTIARIVDSRTAITKSVYKKRPLTPNPGGTGRCSARVFPKIGG